ncbi:hypothetical protein J4E08_22245 [Sagittula sp. NFXS13]|uniref:hypothetical protein n=1 Tax=Sagittula sp. NFXS13 TaxID=2819095 RepID=UPI0032DFCD18
MMHDMIEMGRIGHRCGQPLGPDGREVVSVRLLLEWAFASECASIDFDELEDHRPAAGAEYAIMRQLSLGKRSGEGVRVDTSIGRSDPHPDAEVIASLMRAYLPWSLCLELARLARARSVPRWDLGPQRVIPAGLGKPNQYGQQARVEVCDRLTYLMRGRSRQRDVTWCPVRVVPSSAAIASARRGYLDWWRGLFEVSSALRRVDLDLFVVSTSMPPMQPWKKAA